jgi:hypothetical protein
MLLDRLDRIVAPLAQAVVSEVIGATEVVSANPNR